MCINFEYYFSLDCSAGFASYNGKYYKFPTNTRIWDGARKYCKNIGTGYDLVVIENSEENQFLKTQLQACFEEDDFWIGLKGTGVNGKYAWVDNSTPGELQFGDVWQMDPWMDTQPGNVIKYYIKVVSSFLILIHADT